MTEVMVLGRGLAALTCARLLAGAGHAVRVTCATPPGRPQWLVLPAAAVELLREVWGLDDDPFADGLPLVRRRVRWGRGARTASVAAPGLVVDGTRLSRRLAEGLPRGVVVDELPQPARWSVTAEPPGTDHPRGGAGRASIDRAPAIQERSEPGTDHPHGEVLEVGRRCVVTAEGRLRVGADTATTQVRTSAETWVHLAPLPDRRALVQVMAPGPVDDPSRLLDEQLARTGLVDELAGPPGPAAVVPAAPRVHLSPFRGRRVAVGTAAVRQDPISGSGTAQAVRTAILAAAAIDAIERGLPEHEVAAYYRGRVLAAFREHLSSCLRLYRAAFPGVGWQDELDHTVRVLHTNSPPEMWPYTLAGLRLERYAGVANEK